MSQRKPMCPVPSFQLTVECVHLLMLPAKPRLGHRDFYFTNNRWCSKTKIILWTEFQGENDRVQKKKKNTICFAYIFPSVFEYYRKILTTTTLISRSSLFT